MLKPLKAQRESPLVSLVSNQLDSQVDNRVNNHLHSLQANLQEIPAASPPQGLRKLICHLGNLQFNLRANLQECRRVVLLDPIPLLVNPLVNLQVALQDLTILLENHQTSRLAIQPLNPLASPQVFRPILSPPQKSLPSTPLIQVGQQYR